MTSKVKEYSGEEAASKFGHLLYYIGGTLANLADVVKSPMVVETSHGGDNTTWVFSYISPEGDQIVLNLSREVTPSRTGVKQ